MNKFLGILLRASLAALVVLVATGSLALAHERRDVSRYQFVVGWIVEPALQGEKNGVDLRVSANVSGNITPVLGVEKTLKIEITHVPTGISKTFDLRTIFRDPGHYTSDLIPNASGHYRMRFIGTIDGNQIDETFNSESGGGGYGDIEPSADLQFPEKVASPQEIEAVARHIEEENHELEEAIARTTMMANIGIGAGALGVIVGAAALIASRRRTK